MRKTIILATFVGVGAGAVGVGAAETMKGSDTLYDITNDVVATCLDKVGGNQPVLDINYIGTGSGAGETAMEAVNPAIQRVAPMSKFVSKGTATNNICNNLDPNASPSKSEGINFALDGISIVSSKDTGASTACNGSAAPGDCDRTTDPNAGLARNRTLTVVMKEIVPGPNGSIEETSLAGDDVYDGSLTAIGAERVLPGPNGVLDTAITAGADDRIIDTTVVYTFSDWKDVLRVVYGGRILSAHHWTENGVDKSTTALKDCDSNVRHAIVENYGNLFQVACTTGGCTQLHHAFRRDDVSGTTDTFITLLGLTNTTWVGDDTNHNGTGSPNHFSSFCNGFSQTGVGAGAPPCDIRRDPQLEAGVTASYDWDAQDWDPIRRKCRDDEKVCGRNGTLGVVLPMLPTDFLTPDQAFPPVQAKPSLGFKVGQTAPKGYIVGRGDVVQARCPNGGQSTGTFKCIWPQNDTDKNGAAAQQLLVINDPNNKPGAVQLNQFCGYRGTQADGRVYNLYLRGNNGTMLKDTRATPGAREVYGAFYRIHQVAGSYTHSDPSINPPDGGPLVAPLVPQCVDQDATKQIGCVASVSHCSVGFAGRGSINGVAAGYTLDALQVDALSNQLDACVQKLVPDPTNAYPISRRLFVNTTFGFENAFTEEKAMAECFSNQSFIEGIVVNRDFVKLGTAPQCIDFIEAPAGRCNTGVAEVNACANNGGIALDSRVTAHGSAVPSNTDQSL